MIILSRTGVVSLFLILVLLFPSVLTAGKPFGLGTFSKPLLSQSPFFYEMAFELPSRFNPHEMTRVITSKTFQWLDASQRKAASARTIAMAIVHTDEYYGTTSHLGKVFIEQLMDHPAVKTIYEMITDKPSYIRPHDGTIYHYFANVETRFWAERILILSGGYGSACVYAQFRFWIDHKMYQGGVWEAHLPLGGPVFTYRRGSRIVVMDEFYGYVSKEYVYALRKIGEVVSIDTREANRVIYTTVEKVTGTTLRLVVWSRFEALLEYLDQFYTSTLNRHEDSCLESRPILKAA